MNQDNSSNPLIVGTRNLEDNISDLKAQLASNRKGIMMISQLVLSYGPIQTLAYMEQIQNNAKRNVERALCELSLSLGLKEKDTMRAVEYMDEGSFIALDLTIGKY